jgi:hypothetical protein
VEFADEKFLVILQKDIPGNIHLAIIVGCGCLHGDPSFSSV